MRFASWPDDLLDSLALRLLDHLEMQEYRLLVWGFLEGCFRYEELRDAAEAVVEASDDYASPDEVIDRLRDRCLLYELNAAGETVFRTRFGEAVRLFASLRQIFPGGDWLSSPKLVADYRLSLRARRYPRRNQSFEDVLQALHTRRPVQPLEERALRALLADGRSGLFRLARFQADATTHLLASTGGRTQGTIVCAGTGTGKTLAFYLPCFVNIVSRLERTEAWTQALAIYPRNELLKDQFTEACGQTRKVNPVALAEKGRSVRLGAYFGMTPKRPTIEALEESGWPRRGQDFLCPFLRCPECEGDMVWRRGDVENGLEQLVCVPCSLDITGEEIILTRSRMERTPPDILFTTTEMLNRRMSDSRSRALFGMGRTRERAPYLMLLDEVHTYRGPHGAQVGLMLRRWRQEVRYPVHFVGLSATLNDPQGFLAQFLGLLSGAVTQILAGDDLEEEGREYLLVLRGDPISGTSLLSTTIQAAMLLGRVMDTMTVPRSDGVYGQKVFAFTDDLDVTNRLYHNLLDAEGRDSAGRERTDKEPLAFLRSSERFGYDHARFREGQVWSLCAEIGHQLADPAERLRVGRVSSQDTGVDNASQVVVATSSLEVGYNDPTVGAVIQHKAPRDAAAFLQRKGRAGRRRVTRPWTVVILSDYGRDRLAYQAYEQLLDPVLDRPTLPTENRYILRMQAVYSLMDWIASQLRDSPSGSVWDDFTRPAGNNTAQRRQNRERELLQSLLEDRDRRAMLALHLERALQISGEEVRALFWEPPRALITAVVPTLLRRLETGWRRIVPLGEMSGPEQDYQRQFAPLPDFVPENLFSDLSVPEVTIRTPRHGNFRPEAWTLPLVQALSTMAPGRVTRRFGVQHILAAHWFEPPNREDRLQDLAVEDYCFEYEDVGLFHAEIGGEVQEVRCIRPWTITATQCPPQIKNTSNAQLIWRSQFCPPPAGDEAVLPQGTLFDTLVRGVVFFTYNRGCPVRLRRFAVASDAELRLANGQQRQLHIRFIERENGRRAGVGFEQEADGILFRCAFPEELRQRLAAGPGRYACRTAYFRHRVENDPILSQSANRFRLDWLAQIYLSILLTHASMRTLSLPEAVADLESMDWMPAIRTALDLIFQVVDVEEEANEGGAGGRVHDALLDLFAQEEIRQRLLLLSGALWDEPDMERDIWLSRRLKATLGGALLRACYHLASQAEMGDLLLDIESGPRPSGEETFPQEGEEIWITESVIGGAGIVEEVRRRYQEDPRHFFLLTEIALSASDFEIVDRELTRIVTLCTHSPTLQQAFAGVRNAITNREFDTARQSLCAALTQHHILLSHPTLTSLNARVLRPGSSPRSDALLHKLLERWQQEELALGVEMDARIFCYLAATDGEITTLLDEILRDIGGLGENTTLARYSRLYGLLWPRGSVVRERSLESFNPFSPLPRVDPLLLLTELQQDVRVVEIATEEWRLRAEEGLRQVGIVRLRGRHEERGLLQGALIALAVSPVEVGFLRLFPYAARVDVSPTGVEVTLHLREAIQ